MPKLALIGLGKMGLSHLAILGAHPEIELAAICDASKFLLDGVAKYTGLKTYQDYKKMIDEVPLDGIVVATPSKFHAEIVRYGLDRGLHVFCEKPLVLDAAEGAELAALAESKGLVNQVGYHYRFVGAFQEAKRLLEAGAIGRLHHVRAEAYGPVVLRAKGSTWRSSKNEGGGCIYDYASHTIDLLNFLVGQPQQVSGSVLHSVFSADVDDEVYATLHYQDGLSGQLAVNWSDESLRKMSVKISLWGTEGRINVDRQEIQTYLRDEAKATSLGMVKGWNVKYTTELTEEVWYYLRGEEYSAQIDAFVKSIAAGTGESVSSFRTASQTDAVIEMIVADAARGPVAVATGTSPAAPPAAPKRGWFRRN